MALPKIPDGEFSSVRLQGRNIGRGLPSTLVCHRPSCSLLPLGSPALCRGPMRLQAPPCEQLPPLYPRGPRSGPGYVVPVHPHLSDPMRPTPRHISTSPLCDLYEMPSLGAYTTRLYAAREVDPCFP